MDRLIEEKVLTLPARLKVPINHHPNGEKAFTFTSFLLLHPDKNGWLSIESNAGNRGEIKTKDDILRLFPEKWNWTCSKLHEWDCIFKVITAADWFSLNYKGYFEFGNYQLYWWPGTGEMRLTEGNNNASSKYLVNIGKYTKKVLIQTLVELEEALKEYQIHNSIIPMNPLSPASTAKDLLLSERPSEFNLMNHLDIQDFEFLKSAYKGPRMESSLIGTENNILREDMSKAYLNALAKCPTLRKDSIQVIRGRKDVIHHAHPGSVYLVKFSVPDTYSLFAPMPIRKDGHIRYTSGEFISRVAKPYLDLAVELGDVKFEVLDSLQFINFGKERPWEEIRDVVTVFEDTYADKFKYINAKAIHYPMVGHFMRINQSLSRDTGKLEFVTSTDYNLPLACAMQSLVAVEIYKEALTKDGISIQVDAVSGRRLVAKKGFKLTKPGMVTYLTSNFKDGPGDTKYRKLIEANRDKPSVEFDYPRRMTFMECGSNPKMIGKLVEHCLLNIYPLAPGRRLESIKRVGNLLDRNYTASILSLNEGGKKTWQKEVPLYMTEYLDLFPQQTQI